MEKKNPLTVAYDESVKGLVDFLCHNWCVVPKYTYIQWNKNQVH